jgi:hypothetical protein
MDGEVIHRTKSLCPECKLIIDAELYRKGEDVMIRKVCPEHGEVVDKYWEDFEMYEKMKDFTYVGRGVSNPNVEYDGTNCPMDCGLCARHKTHTALANIVLTNRCHLSCWYCFFFAKEGDAIYEPSMEQIKSMLQVLRNEKPVGCNSIQFTGGEPTLREDLVEIIALTKQLGFDHIQLNTAGIKLSQDYALAKKLKEAGVSNLYMSFDGVTPKTNPKNHWEAPGSIEACRQAGIGIVLVPTVIRGVNEHELGGMINFALNHLDVIRSVNFQPVSLVGRMPLSLREKQRITIPGAIKEIEKQTDGAIGKEDFYSVPCTGAVTRFIEAFSGTPTYNFSIHFACGAGTYIFLDGDKVIPVTRFVDVRGFFEHLEKAAQEIRGKGKVAKYLIGMKTALGMKKFIDKEKQPKGLDLYKMLFNVLVKHDFNSLGDWHLKTLFIGMMHFQDLYNYDIERVEKCSIHYVLPDGLVVPFCAFNVIPEIYRDKVQKNYSFSSEEWLEKHPGYDYKKDKYQRDARALEATELYKKTYDVKNYFAQTR